MSALLIGETVNLNQIKCWFLRRGENRSTLRKTSRSRVENQQTQPTYDAECGNRTRDKLVEGERSHHCANPRSPIMIWKIEQTRQNDVIWAALLRKWNYSLWSKPRCWHWLTFSLVELACGGKHLDRNCTCRRKVGKRTFGCKDVCCWKKLIAVTMLKCLYWKHFKLGYAWFSSTCNHPSLVLRSQGWGFACSGLVYRGGGLGNSKITPCCSREVGHFSVPDSTEPRGEWPNTGPWSEKMAVDLNGKKPEILMLY